MFYSYKKSILRKNPVLPIEIFPSLVYYQECDMLKHLISNFSLHNLSRSASGRLRERGKWSYFGKLVAVKSWPQPEVRSYMYLRAARGERQCSRESKNLRQERAKSTETFGSRQIALVFAFDLLKIKLILLRDL